MKKFYLLVCLLFFSQSTLGQETLITGYPLGTDVQRSLGVEHGWIGGSGYTNNTSILQAAVDDAAIRTTLVFQGWNFGIDRPLIVWGTGRRVQGNGVARGDGFNVDTTFSSQHATPSWLICGEPEIEFDGTPTASYNGFRIGSGYVELSTSSGNTMTVNVESGVGGYTVKDADIGDALIITGTGGDADWDLGLYYITAVNTTSNTWTLTSYTPGVTSICGASASSGSPVAVGRAHSIVVS